MNAMIRKMLVAAGVAALMVGGAAAPALAEDGVSDGPISHSAEASEGVIDVTVQYDVALEDDQLSILIVDAGTAAEPTGDDIAFVEQAVLDGSGEHAFSVDLPEGEYDIALATADDNRYVAPLLPREDPSDPDPSEPTEPDPSDPTQPTDPTDPEPTETDPTGSTDPSDPADPDASSDSDGTGADDDLPNTGFAGWTLIALAAAAVVAIAVGTMLRRRQA
ncbi:hypothetical protein [Agrococcus casei]|nr:hypothetical protein [Agrococcus casei]